MAGSTLRSSCKQAIYGRESMEIYRRHREDDKGRHTRSGLLTHPLSLSSTESWHNYPSYPVSHRFLRPAPHCFPPASIPQSRPQLHLSTSQLLHPLPSTSPPRPRCLKDRRPHTEPHRILFLFLPSENQIPESRIQQPRMPYNDHRIVNSAPVKLAFSVLRALHTSRDDKKKAKRRRRRKRKVKGSSGLHDPLRDFEYCDLDWNWNWNSKWIWYWNLKWNGDRCYKWDRDRYW